MPAPETPILSAEDLITIKHDMFVLELLLRQMIDGRTDDVISPASCELINEMIPLLEGHIDVIDKIIL